jgi:hypothetical protein
VQNWVNFRCEEHKIQFWREKNCEFEQLQNWVKSSTGLKIFKLRLVKTISNKERHKL